MSGTTRAGDSASASREAKLLSSASRLESISRKLTSTFEKYGYTVGQLWDAKVEERVKQLCIDGTRVFEETLPEAKAIYGLWSQPKVAMARRYLRVEMEKGDWLGKNQAGLFNMLECVEKGTRQSTFGFDMHAGEISTAVFLFRGIVDMNRRPEIPNPYFDTIKDSVIIEPRPGYSIPALFHVPDMNGESSVGNSLGEVGLDLSKTEIRTALNMFVGRKVILIPIKNRLESANFEDTRHKAGEIPLHFQVKEPVRVPNKHHGGIPFENEFSIEYTGKLVGTVTAVLFPSLTQRQADEIAEFIWAQKNGDAEPKALLRLLAPKTAGA